METFLATMLGVICALLIEFFFRYLNGRQDRKRVRLRHEHVQRLVIDELKSNLRALAEMRQDLVRLMDLSTSVQIPVWSGLLDEIFEAFPDEDQLKSLDSIYGALHTLQRLEGTYLRHPPDSRLEVRDRILAKMNTTEAEVGRFLAGAPVGLN